MSEGEFEENKSSASGEDIDPLNLVQAVLRETYMESSRSLRDYAEKVRYYNQQKKAIRQYLKEARRFKMSMLSEARQQGIDLCRDDEENSQAMRRLFEKHAYPYEADDIAYELCLPKRVPPEGVDSFESFDAVITEWEERLNTVGDDAQLANIDLQNMLQKQQQALQMMSNMSKSSHDTMMAIIRNLKS